MRLMLTFFRAYPWQSALMLLALLSAGIAENINLSALLPLLNVAIKSNAGSGGETVTSEAENDFERIVNETLANMGLEPTIGVLLSIIVVAVTLKSLLLLLAKKQVGYTAAQVATDLRLAMLRAVLRVKWEYFLHQPVGKLTNSLATEAQRSSDSFVNGATVITLVIQAVIYGSVAVAVSWKATLLSLVTSLVLLLFYPVGGKLGLSKSVFGVLELFYRIIWGFSCWFWLVALLSIGARFLNFTNRFLVYSNEAVLPIYILHQTVIVIATFFIIKLSLPILPALILVTFCAFAGSIIIYDLIVKRIKWVRVLFGMRVG